MSAACAASLEHQILPRKGKTRKLPAHHQPQKTVSATLSCLDCGPRNSTTRVRA